MPSINTDHQKHSGKPTRSVSLKCPEIAVFFDLASESARGILHGFMRYIRLNQPWNVNFISKTTNDVAPSSLKNWTGNGILAHIPDRKTFREIISKNCPIVLMARGSGKQIVFDREEGEEIEATIDSDRFPNLTDSDHPYKPVFIRCNNIAIGQMAARFFLEKGYVHFGYVSYPKQVFWCAKRHEAYTDTLAEQNYPVYHFAMPDEAGADWFSQRDRMRDWLVELPKPIAILAANDFIGRQILEVSQRADIPVPYEVSVLGVDNDPTVCEMTYPSLSSIAVDWDRGGFLAAESLHRQMNGLEAYDGNYGPMRVVSRSSTEFFQVSDPLVVRILELIRINRGDNNLRVSDILRSLPISERRAQERFKKTMGHSIMEEIKKVRMKNISELIRETDLSFNDISLSFGFENANHLGQLFKREFGVTMGEYRRGNREA